MITPNPIQGLRRNGTPQHSPTLSKRYTVPTAANCAKLSSKLLALMQKSCIVRTTAHASARLQTRYQPLAPKWRRNLWGWGQGPTRKSTLAQVASEASRSSTLNARQMRTIGVSSAAILKIAGLGQCRDYLVQLLVNKTSEQQLLLFRW